jgi:hypothetical protein
MGYAALVPVARKWASPGFLLVFANGAIVRADDLTEEHVESAIEGECTIINLEERAILSPDGQEWLEIESIEQYEFGEY